MLLLAQGATLVGGLRECELHDVQKGWFTWHFNLGECESLRIRRQVGAAGLMAFGASGGAALGAALTARGVRLSMLFLEFVDLSDEGAVALGHAIAAPHSSVTMLEMYHTNLGAVGAQAIADGLRGNNKLKTLYLTGNFIGDQGARSLAGALASNSVLERLWLWDAGISVEGATALAAGLSNSALVELVLAHNTIGDTGARVLSQILPRSRQLASLSLQACGITDTGATALAAALPLISTLTTLRLSKNQIGDKGGAALASAVGSGRCKLKRLDVDHNRMSHDTLALLQKAMGRSRASTRSAASTSGGKATVMAGSVSSGTQFDGTLDDLPVSSSTGPVGNATQQTWGATATPSTYGGAAAGRSAATRLAPSVRLRTAPPPPPTLDYCGIEEVETGWNTGRCTGLDVSGLLIGDEGATALAAAALENTALKAVKLNRCGVSGMGAKALGKALSSSAWTLLSLDGNPLRNEGTAALVRSIPSSSSLQTLSLAHAQIGRTAGAVESGSAAPTPDLASQSAEGRAAAAALDALAELLSRARSLTSLTLSSNKLNDEGARVLAQRLASGAIEALSIDSNQIGDAGAYSEVESSGALQSGAPLLVLDLSRNGIGDAGAKALAGALSQAKPPLQSLSLGGNHIGTDGAKALLQMLRTNCKLLSLDLSSNPIPQPIHNEISQLMRRHRSDPSSCYTRNAATADAGGAVSVGGDSGGSGGGGDSGGGGGGRDGRGRGGGGGDGGGGLDGVGAGRGSVAQQQVQQSPMVDGQLQSAAAALRAPTPMASQEQAAPQKTPKESRDQQKIAGWLKRNRLNPDVFLDILRSFGVETVDDLQALRFLSISDLGGAHMTMVQKARLIRALSRLSGKRDEISARHAEL